MLSMDELPLADRFEIERYKRCALTLCNEGRDDLAINLLIEYATVVKTQKYLIEKLIAYEEVFDVSDNLPIPE